jgi:hypothetical protein
MWKDRTGRLRKRKRGRAVAKEKLLVYSYNFYPHENANTNVIMPILEELCKLYDVHIFTCDLKRNLPSVDQYQGMVLYRFRLKPLEVAVSRIFGVFDRRIQDLNLPFLPLVRLIWRVLHVLFTRPRLERILTEYPVNKTLVQRLNSEKYKALLTISAPIKPHMDALTLAKAGHLNNIPWFAYVADPHATFIGLAEHYERLMEKEVDIYRLADAVFTTPELYEDNALHPIGKYRNKTIPVAYANLRPIFSSARPSYLAEGKINCVYTGSLFNNRVRSPEYLYRLIQACDDRFQFHIVCNSMDGTNRALKERYLDSNPNVHWYGSTAINECFNLMGWADVLINLGNHCTNQTPSKIFDYISAGRPIVNIHPLENDTAKRYLGVYPLTLNIQEKESFDPQDAKLFADFCEANYKNSVDFDTVKKLYNDMTPKIVAEKFIQRIELDWQPHDRVKTAPADVKTAEEQPGSQL